MAKKAGLELIISLTDEATSGLKRITGGLKGLAVVGGAAAAAAIVAVGKAAWDAGLLYDDAMDTIITKTGASGDALAGLETDFKRVFTSIPTEAGPAADVIAELNRRVGLTGPTLQEASKQVLEMSRLLGGDATANAALFGRVMGDWGLTAEDAGLALDKVFVASQKTGVGVDSLMQAVVKFGAPLRNMGFQFDESVALLSSFEKEGVNAELVLGSLRIAAGKFAREGQPLRESLMATFEAIQNNTNASEALALGMEVFGARAGPDMVAAIREGRFSVEELAAAMGTAEGAIMETAAATADFPEKLQVLRNKVTTLLMPLGSLMVSGLTAAVDAIGPFIDQAIGWFQNLTLEGSSVAVLWETIRTTTEAVWPVIQGVITTALGIIQGVIETAVGVIRGLFQAHGDEAQSLLAGAWQTVQGVAEAVWPVIQGVIETVLGGIQQLTQAHADGVLGVLTTAWEAVRAVVEAVWPIIQGIVAGGVAIVKGFIDAHGAEIKAFMDATWGQISEIVRLAWELIGAVVKVAVDKLRTTIVPVLTEIQAFVTTHGEEIQQILSGAWTIIRTTIEMALTLIKGVIQVALALIKGDWEGAWTALKGIVSGVWEGIKGIVRGALDVLGGLLGGVQFPNPFAAITGWVSEARGAMDGFINWLKGLHITNPLAGLGGGGGGKATGTFLAAGGLTLVGEAGPELVRLPMGSRVFSNGESQRMASGAPLTINFLAPASAYDERRVELAVERALARSGSRADVLRRTR